MKSILTCLAIYAIHQIPFHLWLLSRNHLSRPHPLSAEKGRDWRWEVYLLLTTKTAAAVTFSCKANMLEKVTICCSSSVLGSNVSVDDSKSLNIWKKIALWIVSGGHVQPQLQLRGRTKKKKLWARKVSGQNQEFPSSPAFLFIEYYIAKDIIFL